jgi:hypothetical protein
LAYNAKNNTAIGLRIGNYEYDYNGSVSYASASNGINTNNGVLVYELGRELAYPVINGAVVQISLPC